MEQFSRSMAWMAGQDGRTVIGHGPFESAATPPPDCTAFYVQDFALCDQEPWKIPSRVEMLESSGERSQPLQASWEPPDPAGFSVVFQEVMAAIHEGNFEKTVPVVTELGIADSCPLEVLMAAMSRQALPHRGYGWANGDSGFAGATPELLFALDGLRLETMALAGTARSEDREVFKVDSKEIREHEYVAQTLVSKLHDFGTVNRQAREILDLGSIVHFLTHITVDLHQPLAPGELIRRLHPTPALGPLPRTSETLTQLLGWRNRLGCPREFGAPFGLWRMGRFEAVVAIRGIWWNGNHLQLPAGCGVIEASSLVSEWRELRLKREAVKRHLES